jgi:hypothetical protein
MIEIKLDKNDAHELHALVYQADMSLVRGFQTEQDLKRFYNKNRLVRIKNLINSYYDAERIKRSLLEKLKTKFSGPNQSFVECDWVFKSLGALETLVYYIEELKDIPISIYINLRVQFMELAFSSKLKPFPYKIIYFARHDIEENDYMAKDYLWLEEIKKKVEQTTSLD